jgi:magnesium/cobalt transport protein CorA
VAEWIDLLDPKADELRAKLPRDVHDDAIRRLLAPTVHDDEPRPRFEGRHTYVFGILLAPLCVQGDVHFREVDLIVTREVLVTVRKTPGKGGAPIELELPSGARAGELAAAVVDEVAEAFLDAVDELDAEVDTVDDGIDEWPAERVRRQLKTLRHEILRVRRLLGPTREALHKVVDKRVDVEGAEALPHEVEIAFGDAYDKLLRAVDGLDLARDLLAGARDYHQAKIANDQNEVMKRLTAIASILLLPTFIVGLYGQNFQHHFPELHWQYGYLWSWTVIIVTTAIQVVYFRRKRWI